jgi:hypothetical protein
MLSRVVWPWAALALLLAAAPAFAAAPVCIVMGPSRDGSLQELQNKVDHLVGPGRVNVRTDFIGAHAGDPDPWFWFNNSGAHVVSVRLIDRKSPHATVGWYTETGGMPAIDGTHGGVALEDWRLRGSQVNLRLPPTVTRFGFYIDHQGGDDPADQGVTARYFTNRRLNDIGPQGRGAVHEPRDGDMQALIFNVSRWMGGTTWLVACEYSDSGCPVGTGPDCSDNDFSDILFTVTADGTTPALSSTFARVKALFR